MESMVLWIILIIAVFIFGIVIGYGIRDCEEYKEPKEKRLKEELEIAELATLKSDQAKDKIFNDELKRIQSQIAEAINRGGNYTFIHFSADKNWLIPRITEHLHIFGYKIEKDWDSGFSCSCKVSWGS
jgi:uncharacterized membrane-anchored protein YhcB (DUF1043 family)